MSSLLFCESVCKLEWEWKQPFLVTNELTFFPWRNSPYWARASFNETSRSHSVTHTIVGMTPLNEWSARLRNLYQTTPNTYKRQTSMLPAAFESTIPASERSQSHALDHAATRIGHKLKIVTGNQWSVIWFYRVERNNTYKILGIKKKTKYGFWGKVLVHRSVLVRRGGASKSSQIFVGCRIYPLRMWALHCAEPRCFRTQIPYLQIFISVFSTIHSFIHSFSILSDDRSKASFTTFPPHSAI